MKLIKISIISLLLTGAAQLAKAQVSVGIGVHIGTPVHRVYYEPAPAPVYYNPAPAYCPPAAPVYYSNPVVVRRYYRPGFFAPRYYGRQVIYRDHFYRGRGHLFGHRW